MKIYIDNDYKCHVSNDGTMREFDLPFLVGKCAEFVEGLRYVPPGECWVESNGECFWGDAVFPWKDSRDLEIVQMKYELTQYETALSAIETALGVTSE